MYGERAEGGFGRTGEVDGVGAGGVEVRDSVRAEDGVGGRAVSGELDLACEVSVPKEWFRKLFGAETSVRIQARLRA